MHLHLRPCVLCDGDHFWMQTTDGASVVRFRLHRLQALWLKNPPDEIHARLYPPGNKIALHISDIRRLLKAACKHALRGPYLHDSPPRDVSGRFALTMNEVGIVSPIDVAAANIPLPT